MSDSKAEATHHGESKIERALRLRRRYDQLVKQRYDNPDAITELSVAVEHWLEAEDALTHAEYMEYQRIYREEKKA